MGIAADQYKEAQELNPDKAIKAQVSEMIQMTMEKAGGGANAAWLRRVLSDFKNASGYSAKDAVSRLLGSIDNRQFGLMEEYSVPTAWRYSSRVRGADGQRFDAGTTDADLGRIYDNMTTEQKRTADSLQNLEDIMRGIFRQMESGLPVEQKNAPIAAPEQPAVGGGGG